MANRVYKFVQTKLGQSGVTYSDPIGDQMLGIPTWCADATPSASPQHGYWITGYSAGFCVFKWRFQYHQ